MRFTFLKNLNSKINQNAPLLVKILFLSLFVSVSLGMFEPDEITVISELEKNAKNGDVNSQHNLGYRYLTGRGGVEQNHSEALKWFMKAANQGEAISQYEAGKIYYSGSKDIKKDYDKALNLFLQAAERFPIARHKIALIYYHGYGSAPKNKALAFKWFMKSAEEEYETAQNDLAYMCFKGEGIEQTYSEAFKWFKASSDNSYPKAQYNLGYMYLHGEGVSKNIRTASYWFEEAAQRWYSKAQYQIALIFIERKEYLSAYKWLWIAKSQGEPLADIELKKIEKELKEGDIALAKELANALMKFYRERPLNIIDEPDENLLSEDFVLKKKSKT